MSLYLTNDKITKLLNNRKIIISKKKLLQYLLFTKGKRGGHKARDWIYDFLRIIDYNHFIEINE